MAYIFSPTLKAEFSSATAVLQVVNIEAHTKLKAKSEKQVK